MYNLYFIVTSRIYRGGAGSAGSALHVLFWPHVSMTSSRNPISYALWVLGYFHLPLSMSHICTMDEIIQFDYPENIEQKAK